MMGNPERLAPWFTPLRCIRHLKQSLVHLTFREQLQALGDLSIKLTICTWTCRYSTHTLPHRKEVELHSETSPKEYPFNITIHIYILNMQKGAKIWRVLL
jgi:hypothetical protein